MTKLSIEPDIREARRALKELGPGVDKAAARALNKTAVAVRKKVIPEIRKERAIKAGLIRQDLRIFRANSKRLVSEIRARGFSIPMRHFGANMTKRGVTVRIKQGTKRTLLKHGNRAAFINAGSKLGPNVFVRESSGRLPIKKWSPVPGIPHVFVKRLIIQGMKTTARQVWPRRFREEIRFEVNKALSRARRG